MCVSARVSPLPNSPPHPHPPPRRLSEMGSVSCDSLQRRDGRPGKPGSVTVGQRAGYYRTPHLLIHIWGGELNLLYLNRPRREYSPCLFSEAVYVFSVCVQRRGCVNTKPLFAHLGWRGVLRSSASIPNERLHSFFFWNLS